MRPLTDSEKKELIRRVTAGETLPASWQKRLFPDSGRAEPIGKEYRLVYEGKLKREEVLAQTPAAPWQLVREFCTERPHKDGWRNLLVWGDNLLALRGLLEDQNRGATISSFSLLPTTPPSSVQSASRTTVGNPASCRP